MRASPSSSLEHDSVAFRRLQLGAALRVLLPVYAKRSPFPRNVVRALRRALMPKWQSVMLGSLELGACPACCSTAVVTRKQP